MGQKNIVITAYYNETKPETLEANASIEKLQRELEVCVHSNWTFGVL